MPKERPRMTLALDPLSSDYPPFFSVVVANRIAGSGHPNKYSLAEQMQFLKMKEGICGVMSLTRDGVEGDVLQQQGVEYCHLPIVDKTPPTIEEIAKGSMFVDRINEKGGMVLVHCREGIGRTGTMIAGWLMLSLGMGAEAAIHYVREKRTGSIHQRHQELRLYQLERACRDPTFFRKVTQGLFDESQYDFCTLKASTSVIMARCNRRFLLHVYFLKLANFRKSHVTLPKYLERARSPFWKPKLGNFKAYVAEGDPAHAQLLTYSEKSTPVDSSLDPGFQEGGLSQLPKDTAEWGYIQQNDVSALVEEAICQMLHARPNEPAMFLSTFFAEKASKIRIARDAPPLLERSLNDLPILPQPPSRTERQHARPNRVMS